MLKRTVIQNPKKKITKSIIIERISKKIQQINGILFLTEDTAKDVALANSAFDADIKYLESEIRRIVDENNGQVIDQSTEELAVLIAECYVNNQFK